MTTDKGLASGLRRFVIAECVVGDGAIGLVGRYAHHLQARHVFVVTDPGVRSTGLVDRVRAHLGSEKLESTVFEDVSPNPRDHQVMAGVDACRRAGADLIVAIGGGSPMDCAKGIGVVLGNGGSILDYEGVDRIARRGPPMIFLPTTAGTASDVSQFAIINDTARRVKIAIVSKMVVPDVSLTDPSATTTMDRHLTACTGLDALTHAIEALVSTARWPVTDLCALDAIRQVAANLPDACDRPNDLVARGRMAQASMEAGYAFSNVGLGAVHAMAHALGGLLDMPHGECNALLLEHVVAFNYESASTAYDEAAAAMGLTLATHHAPSRRAALVAGIRDLRHRVGIAGSLASRGMSREHIPVLAQAAFRDPCLLTNPRKAGVGDLEGLYDAAL